LGLLYHIRFGHASVDYLREAAKSIACLKGVKFDENIKDCQVCRLAKVQRRAHKKIREVAEKPLNRIHSDLIGPIKPVGRINNGSYIVTFTDDAT